MVSLHGSPLRALINLLPYSPGRPPSISPKQSHSFVALAPPVPIAFVSSVRPWTAASAPPRAPPSAAATTSSSAPGRSRGSGTPGSWPARSGRRRASCSHGPPLRPPRRGPPSPRRSRPPARRASWGRAARGGTRSGGGSPRPGAWRSCRRRRRSRARRRRWARSCRRRMTRSRPLALGLLQDVCLEL